MKKKIDLSDVTFLIPVRLDSIERLENLLVVTDFLVNEFHTSILVLEATGYNNKLLSRLLPKDLKTSWLEDFDPIFHRTHYINILVKKCTTPYVAVWDTDIIIPNGQIIDSVNLLRNGKADFVSPFTKFLDTSYILRELFFKTDKIDVLIRNQKKMKSLYTPDPVGGAFMAKREVYLESGIENENFYGWGIEDGERIRRWTILGYTYSRIEGPLFHLTHSRGRNSKFHSDDQYNIKNEEVFRISMMSREQLEKEIRKWN